jgi:hypothetical protein
MASISPPSGGPPRPSGPAPTPRPTSPAGPEPPAARPASGRPAAAPSSKALEDLYRAETAMPVQRTRPAEPAVRAPAASPSDRAARRSDVLARATGGATEAFDPAAERLEEPIEPSTAVLDQAGRPLTPHIDAWMHVLEAGGVEPPSPRGVASEMCGLAEADALGYAAVLHRASGPGLGSLIGLLGKIEIKSFLRNLGADARDGLIGQWAGGFKSRFARHREEAARAGREVMAVTYSSPRSFGKILEKADPEALRAAFGSLSPAARQELWAVVPQKVQSRAAGVLRGLVPGAPAAGAGKPSAEHAPHERTETELGAAIRVFLERAQAGQATPSAEAAALQERLGRSLLEGGAASWRDLGNGLGAASGLGLQGAMAAALLTRCALEGLRQAARAVPPDQAAAVLQIPFSLAGKFDGAAGAVFSALGRHCSEEFAAYVQGRGLWRQLVGHVVEAVRTQVGDSDTARAWTAEL